MTVVGPLQVDCGSNVKWMEEYCQDTDRGTSEDWMAFFWNLWSNGTYRYSINQITNVWEETDPGSSTLGETWGELETTVGVLWPGPGNLNKRNQFFNKGDQAGVDH